MGHLTQIVDTAQFPEGWADVRLLPSSTNDIVLQHYLPTAVIVLSVKALGRGLSTVATLSLSIIIKLMHTQASLTCKYYSKYRPEGPSL